MKNASIKRIFYGLQKCTLTGLKTCLTMNRIPAFTSKRQSVCLVNPFYYVHTLHISKYRKMKYLHLGVSPNFEITVACCLKYLRTLSLKFQKTKTKIEETGKLQFCL